MTASLKYCQQSRFKHLGELHKEWTEAEWASASESPRSEIFRKRATKPLLNRNIVRSILPGLRRKRSGLLLSGAKVLFSDEIKFSFIWKSRFPESGGRVESHRIHVVWSPGWSFHSQWDWWLPCHLLVLVHYVFWSPLFNAVIYQEILEHFRLPSADKLYGDAHSFPAEHGTCPHCQRYQKLVQWPWCYVLDWTANSPDLNPLRMYGVCQEEDDTRPNNADDLRPNNADDLKAVIKVTWASLHLSSATGWLSYATPH